VAPTVGCRKLYHSIVLSWIIGPEPDCILNTSEHETSVCQNYIYFRTSYALFPLLPEGCPLERRKVAYFSLSANSTLGALSDSYSRFQDVFHFIVAYVDIGNFSYIAVYGEVFANVNAAFLCIR